MDMAVTRIRAQAETLSLEMIGAASGASLALYEYALYEDPPAAPTPSCRRIPVHEVAETPEGCVLTIGRFDGPRDRIYSAFRVAHGGAFVPGDRCVTDLSAVARHDHPYPIVETIKGLQVRMVDDAMALGVKHAAINLNQGDIMLPGPGEGVVAYELDGERFYFDEAFLREFDETVKALSDRGVVVTLILLNSPRWKRPMHDDMRGVLLHPRYNPEGFISAFNVMSEPGLRHFRAFVEFVAARYSRADQRHGRVVGYIVGNEIDSQWVWGNAGEMPVAQYMREYGVALRAAWIAARKEYAHARVYVSLDQLWTIAHLDNPLRTYPGRTCLELLNARVREEGNYDWAVAYHPYPEDLRYPDFWNDKTAPDSLDAPRITFKNIEQLPAFLRQEPFLIDGRPRRIILSEQGFNSMGTEESEAFQAAAYALAYRKVASCPEIDAFILHAHVDNLHEFGLNLGLWRVDERGEPLSKKPIYDVFRDIDGPRGDEVIAAAEPFLARRMNRGEDERLF